MRRAGVDSPAFETACAELEGLTRMARLETRGTLRIALKEAGLAASTASPADIAAVAASALVPELVARGIANAGDVCRELARRFGMTPHPTPDACHPGIRSG